MNLIHHLVAPARPDAAVPRLLVVVLHGFAGAAANRPSMVSAIAGVFSQAAIYAPELPYRSQFCDEAMVDIVACLADEISRHFARESYDDIILVGHSTGALVARKLVLVAWGMAEDVKVAWPAGADRLPWAKAINRLVFLAAINRGWTFNSAIGFWDGFLWRVGTNFLQLRGWLKSSKDRSRQATILQIRRGSAFLAATRLQWLELMADPARKREKELLIVQVIGTVDDIVSPEDAVDHVLDSTLPVDRTRSDESVWARFFMLEMPQTSHVQASVLFPVQGPDDAVHAERRAVLKAALEESADALIRNQHFIRRRHMEDDLPPLPNPAIRDVVFVIHGIRDKGFWTKKIARKIKELAGKKPLDLATLSKPEREALAPRLRGLDKPKRDLLIRSITASYGYFPMAPFVLRWLRQEKVEWLLDLYVETKARYPNATLHYVGHSNGTYLLAGALDCCPRVRFERVVFAGSVVRRDYHWPKWLGEGENAPPGARIKAVMNYVATADWVVAIFPNALQRFVSVDLGSAGHDGFDAEPDHPRMLDIRYVEGNHSAGIKESQWDEIASFVLEGTLPLVKGQQPPLGQENPDYRTVQDGYTLNLADNAFRIICVAVFFAALIVVLPLAAAVVFDMGPLFSAMLGMLSLLLALLIKAVLLRF
ncbi:alpha/beta hydrolase [Bosea sp. 685]|uniref:esterase/lipase family protein n=1 Tax=Bosea sp. 685 TaxID=3080057 RepID=UPI0028931D33|nr:alpha/beta hydrolase [Bosea sp. 685]WNJ92167.1 alpha/beta hydrolase [Bosea sp. 685]